MSSTNASLMFLLLLLLLSPSNSCGLPSLNDGNQRLCTCLTLDYQYRFDGRTIRVDKASDSGPRAPGGRGGGGGGYMARGGYGAPPMPYGPPQGYPMPGMNMPPQPYGRGYAPQPPYGAPQGLYPLYPRGNGADVVMLTGQRIPAAVHVPGPQPAAAAASAAATPSTAGRRRRRPRVLVTKTLDGSCGIGPSSCLELKSANCRRALLR